MVFLFSPGMNKRGQDIISIITLYLTCRAGGGGGKGGSKLGIKTTFLSETAFLGGGPTEVGLLKTTVWGGGGGGGGGGGVGGGEQRG